ncbi:uncharacterized protein PAC_10332 [Phialocephala subalpina]|uniref:Uncharacterized protein n=1 Tax=Phialocephala subalpina TaxID=576137 RepID=A0A1L7X5Y5_9HELO|nr:uncharacterized protein PAC_10332 [Phialocephala subalpina]
MASQAQAQELTALAQIYSHPLHGRNPYLESPALAMNHTVLENIVPLKSGLTPLYPEDFQTDAEKARFKILSQYQRSRFNAFTTAELHKSGALAPLKTDGQYAFLTEVPIHPLLQQARWLEPLPLHLASVSNHVVWDVMVPSLKLASKLLTQPESSLWYASFGLISIVANDTRWHALLFGDYEQKMEDLNQDINFCIINGMVMNPPNVLGGYNASAQTIPQSAQEKVTVEVTRELIEPLLNDEITTAERLLCIFVLATTIVHELAHTVWIMIQDDHASESEPYFEDEVVCELYNWPSAQTDADGYDSPLLKTKPKNWDIINWIPVNLDYFFDVNCTEFWNTYVRKNDPSSIYFGSKYWGIRCDGIDHSTSVVYAKQMVREKDDIIIDVSKMTEEEIGRARRENARRLRGREIIKQVSALKAEVDKVGASVTNPSDYNPRSGFSSDGNKLLPTPPCPRFNEIRQYLFNTRVTLAWDTLHFRIPDYVLYAYIKREGGLQITFEEWRDFLITCNNNKMLFNFEYMGSAPTPLLGVVSRNDRGWRITALPVKVYPKPSPLKQVTCIRAIQLLKQDEVSGGFTDQKLFRDFDKDLLRRKANELLAKNPFPDSYGNQIIGNLSVDDFDQCIALPKPVGRIDFIFGPPGIIRKHKNTKLFGS